MKIAYVSGPYRAKTLRGVIDNIRKAEAVAIELWNMGYATLTPHLNTQLFPEEGQINYIKGDLEFISRLHNGKDIIVMLEGWENSNGARQELSHAINLGIKSYRWPKDKQKLKENV